MTDKQRQRIARAAVNVNLCRSSLANAESEYASATAELISSDETDEQHAPESRVKGVDRCALLNQMYEDKVAWVMDRWGRSPYVTIVPSFEVPTNA